MARRNHKERSQPAHRAKLGLLEKHKDYVHRARDYKSKQDRIKKLREKAAFRNKDEFYWGMIKGQTKGGVAIADRGHKALDTDVVKILKSQDLGYVRVQIAKDEKKIRDLRTSLEISSSLAGPSRSTAEEWDAMAELAEVEKLAEMGIIIKPQEGVKRKGKAKAKEGHVIFAEGKDEFEKFGESSGTQADNSDIRKEEETIDLGWAEPISSKKKGKSKAIQNQSTLVDVEEDADELAEEARENRMEHLTLLSAYLARLKLLRQAESKLEITKGLMGKGGVAKRVREDRYVEDENAPEDENGEKKRFEGKMWKWKLERRR
ncbi:uncharacterized protein I303_104557 [Kwoniella dejecticola CBS 10117]|uniref:U3 small nucleolar RNA-associated protein 11 n=1 Tax=Kwoniella dejecticola CBS 10117 TaxID=1296121 RepID=A0A1A6A4Z6_9TREE|nr:U3 small nucleolar RNA-associated protein 11 [Kwoniella dejecticola CBS 10117]OBR85134.1 U3 small nucleolar RNA-associated protein 11 [Kwoniella dejecticola CBS 10117]